MQDKVPQLIHWEDVWLRAKIVQFLSPTKSSEVFWFKANHSFCFSPLHMFLKVPFIICLLVPSGIERHQRKKPPPCCCCCCCCCLWLILTRRMRTDESFCCRLFLNVPQIISLHTHFIKQLCFKSCCLPGEPLSVQQLLLISRTQWCTSIVHLHH